MQSQTRYNTDGQALVSVQKQLASALSGTLETKQISINERGLVTTQWTEYLNGAKRKQLLQVPTSNIVAESVMVDGQMLSQTDNQGITQTMSRTYTANGMVLSQTDGRGNTQAVTTDIAGRTVSATDAAGNVTTTTYCSYCDSPAVITDAQGNTAMYKYDIRGRKIAEWGSGIQPACFAYNEVDRLVSLTTFRAGTEIINTDPSDRTDGDVTSWLFDRATGLELRKTYADGSFVTKTYDAFNRLATETDARGVVKTHSYEPARGLLLGTSYSDGTSPRSYSYNHLGQVTQVMDDAGTRSIGYNAFGEQETDNLIAGDVTHLITELRDDMGRSVGYTYAKNGSVQQSVSTGYGTDGRIATAGGEHGGVEKLFSYNYLKGANFIRF